LNKVAIIGSGFAGLSAACYLAKEGFSVEVFEKNSTLGGRARKFDQDGFMFDMGPSWYWMPEVFENFFNHFGKSVSDYYDLVRLDPSYQVFFQGDEKIALPAGVENIKALFESLEPGSAQKLDKFLKEAEYKYKVGMNEFVLKPSKSIFEFADFRVLSSLFKLQMLTSLSRHVRSLFKDKRIIEILEFPVLFLGATPAKIPALYSLMNYADLSLGTWYPMGGMNKIVEGMVSLATSLGVTFHLNSEVTRIEVHGDTAKGIVVNGKLIEADFVLSGADYEHTEQKLLTHGKLYDTKYWESRVLAPSSLLYYIGVNKKIDGLLHHNLFFDEDFGVHAHEIYNEPKWPNKPLFYVSAPSITDPEVAPAGSENLFLLIPVAPGLEDTPEIREKYFHLAMDRLEKRVNQDIRSFIVYKRSFAHSDFVNEYHSFKGNAYGLANTLMQTAFLKPKMVSPKVKNLFFTGQLTTPGPGVPPSLISGQVVATEISKSFKTNS
jgi:phytoene desaturase